MEKAKRLSITLAKVAGVSLVILLILAILFPLNSCGCERLPNTCITHEKQIGLALLQSVQDNDETYPSYAASSGSSQDWRTAIFPYCKSKALYQCPENRYHEGYDGLPYDYGANYLSGDRGLFAGPGEAVSTLASLHDPARLISVVDMRGDQGPAFILTSRSFSLSSERFLYLHAEGNSHFLFADGM